MLDAHGNLIQPSTNTTGKPMKMTKTQRKTLRTMKEQDRLTTPEKSKAMDKGYSKIFALLERGCNVSAA